MATRSKEEKARDAEYDVQMQARIAKEKAERKAKEIELYGRELSLFERIGKNVKSFFLEETEP